MSAIDEPQLLTIDQVASLCQVSTKTVYRAIRRGALSASRLGQGGAYRVRPEAMANWIDACAAPVTAHQAEPPAATPQRTPALVPRTINPAADGTLTVQPEMGRRA